MKLLLIAPTHPHLNLWQPQNLWRRALSQLGHQVKLFPLKQPRLKLINTLRLKRLIKSWQPDKIFFSAGIDALLPIKNSVFFSGVPFTMLSRREQQIGLNSCLVVTNDPAHVKDWLEAGAPQAFCLPISAIDSQLHRRTKPVKKYQSDVCFIGGLLKDRQQLFKFLLKQGIDLKIYGTLPGSTQLDPALKSAYAGPIWSKDMIKVYSSAKIGLNPVPKHMPTGGNLRTFEIPASGALQIASRTHPNWFTDKKDIILYKNPTDLITKINYYLTHNQARHRIAVAGYNRTHRDHTYQKRFALLIKTQLSS